MKKKLVFIVFILIPTFLYCQNYTIPDTVFVIKKQFSTTKSFDKNVIIKNNVVLLRRKGSSDDFKRFVYFVGHSYFIFKTTKGEIIEEGFYDGERFMGYYKSYYSNGKLKNKGYYNGDEKRGIWEFYKRNGKLDKIIDYGPLPEKLYSPVKVN